MLKKSAIEGLRGFLKHAETLKPPNNLQRENGFAKEFQEIKEASSRRKKDPKYSTHHGEKDVNRPKNRYKDIMPYDYSRIILPGIEGKEGSDYINGNYIKGPTEEVVYLAAQGPLPSTVNDFWRMILSHQTQVIVMACREYELGKLKCKRYWPEKPDEKLTFDSCVVSLISQEEMGDGFVIRTLSAKDENGELKVTQFHYTAWPDHDVPRSATPLIELTMSFRAFVGNDNNVPVVVHCSAGCGRTGTICALDYALSLIKLGRTDNFSVFDIVSTLRRQRIAMVQTKEQYELVYKAVKEIVSDELLKQRTSMHTYVNVSVGEEMPEGENTYENVEFIRSIQRLHEEEKNAARKPKELPSKGIVVAPKKDVVLAPQKNVPQRSQPDVPQNRLQDKYTSNHIQGSLPAKQKPEQPGNVSKDNLQQPTTKPPIKKKPQSGYENVLPLSMANPASKPTIEPKPQNYVNVAIGNQKTNTKEDDYVNIPPPVTKSVPVPDKGEYSKKSSKPVLAAHPVPTKPLPPHPGYQKMASLNGDGKDYVIPPPYLKEEEKTSDYVIIPSVPAPAKPVEEGNLLDLSDSGPSSLPILQQTYQSDQEVPLDKKIKTLDPLSMTDLSRSSPSLQTKDPDHHPRKQSRTSGGLAISGQYSLVSVSDSGSPNQSDVKDPFENVPKMKGNLPAPKGRSSLGTVESVVADSASVKLEKPAVAPRRASEALLKSFVNQATVVEKGDVTHTLPKGKAVLGTYSMVDLPNSNSQSNVKSDSLIDLNDETTRDSSQNIPHCRVKKSHSTDNIISSKPDLYSSLQTSKEASTSSFTKRQSFDANESNYSTVSAPLTRRRSEDILSSPKSGIYSSADREAPVKVALDLSVEERKESGDVLGSGYVRKKPVGVRRSNSGVTAPSADFSLRGEVDNLYATVGAKSRDKRRPLAVDIRWSNDDSPVSSLERPMNRSSNSSSSLRSFNSTSSNDSLEDAPPVPSKTADTYLYPDDEDAYDNVQKSSQKSTLNRIKNKAKNMMHSGPHGPKISLGRKNAASTDSLASGEGQDSYTSHKGYGTHIGKPQGPRQCPNHWPKFKK